MGLFSKKRKQYQLQKDVDPNDLPLEVVWAEFSTEFRLPTGELLVQARNASKVVKWLRPGSSCPIGMAFMRFAVAENRLGKSVREFDAFYDSGEPPAFSLAAISDLSKLLEIEIIVFHEPVPGSGEYLQDVFRPKD